MSSQEGFDEDLTLELGIISADEYTRLFISADGYLSLNALLDNDDDITEEEDIIHLRGGGKGTYPSSGTTSSDPPTTELPAPCNVNRIEIVEDVRFVDTLNKKEEIPRRGFFRLRCPGC